MTSTVTGTALAGYLAGLRRGLPAGLADEVADGLIETYEDHLAAGDGERAAADAAVAEFGDLATVIREFIRHSPGRRTARLLLATGPAAAACWTAALAAGHAWAWPVSTAVRLCFGLVLLLTVFALAVAASSRRSYTRTRLALLASPALFALDATAVTSVLLFAPALTGALGAAVAVSLARIAVTAWSLPRLARC